MCEWTAEFVSGAWLAGLYFFASEENSVHHGNAYFVDQKENNVRIFEVTNDNLDLARALERALNRARMPLAYTQGFNRRPRMQFASALALGFTSECELLDIWLVEKMNPEQVLQQLMARMAPGITIRQVREAPLTAPNLQISTRAATYVVLIEKTVERAALQARIEALLAAPAVNRQWRGREYDLRPLIHGLQLAQETDEALRLTVSLALQEGETGRPDELLAALGLDPLAAHIHRVAIVLADDPP